MKLTELYDGLVAAVTEAAPGYQVLANEWFDDVHPPVIIVSPVTALKLRDKSFTSARARFELRILWSPTSRAIADQVHEALEPSDPQSLVSAIDAALASPQRRFHIADEITVGTVQLGQALLVEATVTVTANT